MNTTFSGGVNTPQSPGSPQPPHNLEVEQALLGALLLEPSAWERVPDHLAGKHFFEGLHGELFDRMLELGTNGKSPTVFVLKGYFEGRELDEHTTVAQYLGRLMSRAVSTLYVGEYAATIIDLHRRRELILIGEDITASAYALDSGTTEAQIESAEAALYQIAEHGQAGTHEVSFEAALGKAVSRVSEAYQRGGALAGLPTGYPDLDKLLGGLQASDLIILAGRPAIGKTALAVNMAVNAAKQGKAVGIFSMEMSDEQLALRILAEESSIGGDRLRRGAIDEHEARAVMRRASEIAGYPIHIDHSGGLSIAQVAARARRIKRRHHIDLLIIDYLQLMRGSKKENRTQELTEITMGLKALAKELDIPVIALSQLSREVEKRADKRPMMADLRESGSIEQDADVILFVYRDEYYLSREEPDASDILAYDKWRTAMESARGLAEIIAAKNRHGPTGSVKLAFDGRVTRFSSLSQGRA